MGEKDVEKKKKKRERDDGGSKDSTPKKSKKLSKDEAGQKSSSKKKKPDETAATVKEKETPIKENTEKSEKKVGWPGTLEHWKEARDESALILGGGGEVTKIIMYFRGIVNCTTMVTRRVCTLYYGVSWIRI